MAGRLLHTTTSLCAVCKEACAARVVARDDGAVWMEKTCATHGGQEVRLSVDASWYEATRAVESAAVPPPDRRPVERGCPYDCGPCEHHTQKIRMPVVTITSACDLACPICYVHNKNEAAYHMSLDDMRAIVARLGDLDLINLTGGEPTLHPQFLDIVRVCREAGIHRVSACSHGLGLAKREDLVEAMAALGVRIALSFDTFDDDVDARLNGVRSVEAKLACLDLLERHGVDTTLITVMTGGANDHEIGRVIAHGLGRRNVRHFEIHTITFTGQGGVDFDRGSRIDLVTVLDRIAAQSGPIGLTRDDFVPSPCAHPLCYQIAYLLMADDGGPPVPFTRFMPRETLRACLADRLYLEPSPKLERALHDAVDRLWADDGDARSLKLLDGLIRRLFPVGKPLPRHEALRRSEEAVKAIYVHSHMDEETFDVERAMQCCDSNCYADGRTVPVCNYNVLYRDTETRFMEAPRAWGERAGGRRLPLLGGGAS